MGKVQEVFDEYFANPWGEATLRVATLGTCCKGILEAVSDLQGPPEQLGMQDVLEGIAYGSTATALGTLAIVAANRYRGPGH